MRAETRATLKVVGLVVVASGAGAAVEGPSIAIRATSDNRVRIATPATTQ